MAFIRDDGRAIINGIDLPAADLLFGDITIDMSPFTYELPPTSSFI